VDATYQWMISKLEMQNSIKPNFGKYQSLNIFEIDTSVLRFIYVVRKCKNNLLVAAGNEESIE
jgi:hypothetical protein